MTKFVLPVVFLLSVVNLARAEKTESKLSRFMHNLGNQQTLTNGFFGLADELEDRGDDGLRLGRAAWHVGVDRDVPAWRAIPVVRVAKDDPGCGAAADGDDQHRLGRLLVDASGALGGLLVEDPGQQDDVGVAHAGDQREGHDQEQTQVQVHFGTLAIPSRLPDGDGRTL